MSEPPFFSVIVPTYRRPAALARCLGALSRQDYPRDGFEVIVADDGSGSPPGDVVAHFAAAMTVELVRAPHGGPAAARNSAAARARGRVLALTDDDCEPDPGWLRALDAAMRANPAALVGGRVENGLPDNLFAAASQHLIGYLYEYAARDPASAIRFFTTNNLALSRERFDALGGFDAAVTRATAEDRDLCDRWRRAGGTLVYEPAAVVRHCSPLSFGGFVRQHFRYGRGAVHFHDAREARGGARVRIEPASFYLGMLRYPARSSRGWRVPACATLLALSQFTYAAGYYLERMRTTRPRSVSPRA